MFSKLFTFLFIILSVTLFYFASMSEYTNHIELRRAIVNHPEFIPTASSIRLAAGGYENVAADSYWLQAIQYIGSNAVSSVYKEYLYVMLDVITDLNPQFTYPYEIGALLLPSYNDRYENLSQEKIDLYAKQGMMLGEKGLRNTCDMTKIEKIKNEVDLKKLWTDPAYQNPCTDPMIPYYLGYIAYWNLHDAAKASEYYRIASANTETPVGARTMAAIMQGKTWDREKAIIMFLSLAEGIEGEKQTLCRDVSWKLGNLLLGAFSEKATFNGAFLSQVEAARRSVVKQLKEENVDPSQWAPTDNFCSTYLNKAVREMNMSYLETADNRYFQNKKQHALDPKTLFDAKYIDYIPQDFQTGSTKWSPGIVYFYNTENGHWDYKMGE